MAAPVCVTPSSAVRAIPKSMRYAKSLSSSRMFDGFTSRCTSPVSVSGVQRRGDLLDDRTARGGVERTVVEQGVQVGAGNEPHRHVQPSVDLADVVDRYDVAVVEACSGADFAAESLFEFGVFTQMREQHLEGHDTVDLGVVGAPDLAHSAATEQLDQLVTTEWRAFHRLTITAHRLAGSVILQGAVGLETFDFRRRGAALFGRLLVMASA